MADNVWLDVQPLLLNCLKSFGCAWLLCLILTILYISVPWGTIQTVHTIGYFISDSLVNWRLNYLNDLTRIVGPGGKLLRLAAEATELYRLHIAKIVTGVVLYESTPIVQESLSSLYPVEEPEWVGSLKTSISNSSLNSLLDLNIDPPALEEVTGHAQASPGGAAGALGSPESQQTFGSSVLSAAEEKRANMLAATNSHWYMQHKHKPADQPVDWHVFDPTYGVIDAKLRDMWRNQEEKALRKVTEAWKHKKVLPVRGTLALAEGATSPLGQRPSPPRITVSDNGGGDHNSDDDDGSMAETLAAAAAPSF